MGVNFLAYSVIHGEWNLEIYTLDLATLQATRITHNTTNDTNPEWMP